MGAGGARRLPRRRRRRPLASHLTAWTPLGLDVPEARRHRGGVAADAPHSASRACGPIARCCSRRLDLHQASAHPGDHAGSDDRRVLAADRDPRRPARSPMMSSDAAHALSPTCDRASPGWPGPDAAACRSCARCSPAASRATTRVTPTWRSERSAPSPTPGCQPPPAAPLALPNGRRVEIDLAYPDRMIAIEMDGWNVARPRDPRSTPIAPGRTSWSRSAGTSSASPSAMDDDDIVRIVARRRSARRPDPCSARRPTRFGPIGSDQSGTNRPRIPTACAGPPKRFVVSASGHERQD